MYIMNITQHTNRVRDRNHVVISFDEEKASDMICHFMLENESPLNKLGTEESNFK